MIDLHTHTTASDGRSSPADLVREAAGAGVHVLAVTDHDTVAAIGVVADAADAAGLGFVPGIEITAVHEGRDVHVLGYFFDPESGPLAAFLREQRADRRRRVFEMAARLDDLGARVDGDAIVGEADRHAGRAVGRPAIAAALVAGGHAQDLNDAFDRYLAEGRPAFVSRRGASPADVVTIIRGAGGLASIAHPGKTGIDPLLPDLARAGLTGIEVFHPDHTEADVARYRAIVRDLGLVATGGSDYHGPGSGRTGGLGLVGMPEEAFAQLVARADRARPA